MRSDPKSLSDWSVASTPAGAVEQPDSLGSGDLQWLPLAAPGTVAAAMRTAGLWTDESMIDFDADDWWFRTSFAGDSGSTCRLRFAGIATIADVWLNGEHLLHSEDMFMENVVPFVAATENELVLVCRSLRAHLAARRPRGRWKTRLVEAQQLRWVRTCLLGRMPTWPPNAAPVGPWRPVEVLVGPTDDLEELHLETRLVDGIGQVKFKSIFDGPTEPTSARLCIGEQSSELLVTATERGWSVAGSMTIADVLGWFPATHGIPTMYKASVILDVGHERSFDLPPIGFRSISVDQADGAFGLAVNGVPIFCRGACWVPIDPVGLWSSREALRAALMPVVDAGMNMIRITGTMVPEQDDFYELCDELGVLVWHDMMFANMDYPIGDADFAALVRAEVAQLLSRLQNHPCVAIVCGGSEVEQQAIMMGLDPATFANKLGRTILPALVVQFMPDVQYVPCSPSGGVFPFSMSTGVSHYYGVSAYLRPLDDARRAGIRFTSECLAFSNVPCQQSVEEFLRDGERPGHAPRWKARVPRDRGTGWDFEDVRDHYVRTFFDVDPMKVRYADPDRYLDLGRAASCIAIESTITEWRRAGSSCAGALVFTLRDMAEGAGWGLIDVKGRPKAAYYGMARASKPLAVLLTDEGLNGLVAHVHNDLPNEFEGGLHARLFGAGGNLIAQHDSKVAISANGSRALSVDAMFDGFRDLTYAFRFGPPTYELVSVNLVDRNDQVLSRSFHFPAGHQRAISSDSGLSVSVSKVGGYADVKVSSRNLARFVNIDLPGWIAEDAWFHLAPGDERVIRCRQRTNPAKSGQVRALNSFDAASLEWSANSTDADDVR
jgi:beta-mannosidase